MIHQVDGKCECLLLSPRFIAAKFELVFVLTLENAFSQRFHVKATLKPTERALILLKNGASYF